MSRFMTDCASLGAGCFPLWMAQRERLRGSLAKLLGTKSELVGLGPGCTRAITDVALALPWLAGERLLTFDREFPANVAPWQHAAALRGGSVKLCALPEPDEGDAGEMILESVEQELKKARLAGTPVRFVATSLVQFQSGLRMPVQELAPLCHKYDAYLLVDGIQGCGVVPIELEAWGVDAFFCGSHKWMLGPEGVGFLALSTALASKLRPLTAGWLSHPEGADFLFRGGGHLRYDRELHPAPLVFEGSTISAVGFAGLEAGVDISLQLGASAIFNHVQQLHELFEPIFSKRGFRSLRATDPRLRSCILAFDAPAGLDVPRLFVEMKRRGVMVSIPDGRLRLAPHFSNSSHEAAHIESALEGALKELS